MAVGEVPGAPNENVPGAQRAESPGARPPVSDPPGVASDGITNKLPTDVGELQRLVLSLRRQSGDYRIEAKSLRERVIEADTRAEAAEKRFASADTNTSQLIDAKNAEIKTLRDRITSLETTIATFETHRESERDILLNQLPESIRDRYGDFSVEQLRTVISTYPPAQKSEPVTLPAGKSVSDLQRQIDEAADAGNWDLLDQLESELRKQK